MARQLLADPDWVRKVEEKRPEKIIRCIYCNVCKQLDENFKTVTCFLWPKGVIQAPHEDPSREGPRWPAAGAGLSATLRTARCMHEASGLLSLLDSGLSMAEAEQRVLDYVRSFVADPGKAPLAGNTIGTDRAFLARDMPTFERHVHYRSVDVSSIKELVRRWYPRVYYQAPAKAGNHRALADVRESIEELRYYREAVFVPLPGPGQRPRRRRSRIAIRAP